MPRDLFAQTLTPPHTPQRSRWTILGSILAHVVLVGALLILPVLSAFDTFVVRANNALEYTLPAMTVPQAPPSPSKAPALAPDINPDAAPSKPPEKAVTTEVTVPPPPGSLYVPGGTGTGPGTGLVSGLGTSTDLLVAPPPAPPAPGPVRPGGDIKPPTRITYFAPTYPSLAKSARIEGTVYLEATIDAEGVVRDVRVLRSIPLLDDAAKAAVSQWRYTPTKLNGVAVPVILTVTVTFTLR